MQSEKQTLLIVEDDQDIRDALTDLLEIEGCKVFGAANGREALKLLKEIAPPDLIVLDLMMPVMNGLEFLDAREKTGEVSKIPVVVVSAIANRAKLAGKVAAVLKKPIEFDHLMTAVKQYGQVKQVATPLKSA